VKSFLKKIYSIYLKHFDKEYQNELMEKEQRRKLLSAKRYTNGKANIFGKEVNIVDSLSFLFQKEEIFQREVYYFESENKNPVIIDAGSNIGLSVIYFKKLFPEAKIIAFEPDPKIYQVLSSNLFIFDFNDVETHEIALSDSQKISKFRQDNSDSGSLMVDDDNQIDVKVDLLSNYITEEIDFLKIDIEGAEVGVIKEIEPKLNLVRRIFIEYHSIRGQQQELDIILQILSRNGFNYNLFNQNNIYKNFFVGDEQVRHCQIFDNTICILAKTQSNG
jgi:FkbM family methyltransferase